MKKKLAVFTTMLLSFNAYAATTLDGIWSCQLNYKASSMVTSTIYQNYITIHSKADGQVLFANLKESTDYNFFGYGLGTFSGNTYTGSTKHAMPFNLSLDTDNILSGKMDGVDSLNQQKSFNVKCVKVW